MPRSVIQVVLLDQLEARRRRSRTRRGSPTVRAPVATENSDGDQAGQLGPALGDQRDDHRADGGQQHDGGEEREVAARGASAASIAGRSQLTARR